MIIPDLFLWESPPSGIKGLNLAWTSLGYPGLKLESLTHYTLGYGNLSPD